MRLRLMTPGLTVSDSSFSFSVSSPKGTVYEKTDAQVEMKKINREEFWEQAKVGAQPQEVCVLCFTVADIA